MEQLLGGGGATTWFTVRSERALDADTCDWTELNAAVHPECPLLQGERMTGCFAQV